MQLSPHCWPAHVCVTGEGAGVPHISSGAACPPAPVLLTQLDHGRALGLSHLVLLTQLNGGRASSGVLSHHTWCC